MVTVALIGVATPAMSTARVDHAESSIDRQLTALGDRIESLVTTNDPTVGPGARHVTTIQLPRESRTSAGVDFLRFQTRSGVGIASWRVGDAGTQRTRLVGTPIQTTARNLTLESPGEHRLVFALRLESGQPVIRVRKLRNHH
jgi:hypothetical protein